MTLQSDQPPFEPGLLSPALNSGHRRSSSLILGRLQRGVRRQWPLFVVLTAGIAALGAAYDLNGGAALSTSTLAWLPLGAAVALLVGFVRELERSTITTPASLSKYRGYGVLGAAPDLTTRALRELPPDKRTPLGCLAFAPASPFAAAFRDLQSAISDDGVVAFVSARPEEGATTIALCTAISAMQQGRSVIILDCDIRRRTLSHVLDCDLKEGLLEACERPDDWSSFVEEEPETGLPFIPAARVLNPWRTLIGSPGFGALIASLRRSYDLVVLDCPPALNTADGALIAGMADKCVTVLGWDRTRASDLRKMVQRVQRHSDAPTNVYVNRVPAGYRFARQAAN